MLCFFLKGPTVAPRPLNIWTCHLINCRCFHSQSLSLFFCDLPASVLLLLFFLHKAKQSAPLRNRRRTVWMWSRVQVISVPLGSEQDLRWHRTSRQTPSYPDCNKFSRWFFCRSARFSQELLPPVESLIDSQNQTSVRFILETMRHRII